MALQFICEHWLTDLSVISLVAEWPDPPLAFSVSFAEAGTRVDCIPDRPRFIDTLAVNHVNNPGTKADQSNDLGMWQLNSFWHPVGDNVAFNPFLATDYAFRISAGGTNFGSWTTFRNGSNVVWLPRGREAWDRFRNSG